ncbi:MAG: hypothetical protein SWY16_25810 [Cyanobacteriota bacterium]|nr:hypothetical protein [Cyanobacteriota bacterium]
MSEYITHIAFLDDCRELALFADSTIAELKQSLQNHLRASQLGSVTSKGDKHTIDLLQESKKAWPSDEAEQMLAFFFGWRTHIAADRQLKSLFRLLEPEIYLTPEVDGPTSVSIYHDLFVLRELYDGGELQPFTNGMLALDRNVRNIEPIFTKLWQNSLLDLHTFTTQERQPESWFQEFLQQRQTFYVDTERYVAAHNDLDTDKMQNVVETHRFYDRSDPLIELTRSLRQGQPDRSIDLETALEAAKTQSHYARALRRNWYYLQATAAYWNDYIDLVELQRRFEVDAPHSDPEIFKVLEDPDRQQELLQKWHETGGSQ